MTKILFTNGRFLSDGTERIERHLCIDCEDRTIKSLEYFKEIPPRLSYIHKIDLEEDYLAPGLIDIQLNGGYTKYFSLSPNTETLLELAEASLEFGTPFFYATLISSPIDTIHRAIDTVREAMHRNPYLLGLHLEGPFLNSKRRGAHNESVLHSPTDSELMSIIEHGHDTIKLMTIAPEMLSTSHISLLLKSDIQLSLGHSDCTYEVASNLFDSGVNMVTHLYNAMSSFTHRAPGLVGAALLHPSVYTPIILDGRHCHWEAARLAYKLKGERLILLTDATVLGRRMQEMAWEGLHAILTSDGFYINPDGNLAGSAISMGEAVVNAQKHLGVSPAEAIEMATGRVARAIGAEHIGRIAAGCKAIFSRWHQDGSNRFTTIDVNQIETL